MHTSLDNKFLSIDWRPLVQLPQLFNEFNTSLVHGINNKSNVNELFNLQLNLNIQFTSFNMRMFLHNNALLAEPVWVHHQVTSVKISIMFKLNSVQHKLLKFYLRFKRYKNEL